MRPKIVVGGLGPAGANFITNEVMDELRRAKKTFLRTERHPAAEQLAADFQLQTFDNVYDSADTIEHVYSTIVALLVQAAKEHGEVLYLVPGSPLIAESTVVALRQLDDVDVEIKPALSFLDLAWQRLGVDPFATGPRIVDAYSFESEAAGERSPLLVGQCDNKLVLSDIKLSFEDETPETVVVLQRLGLDDENVEIIKWEDLDRSFEPDHLTSIWIPEIPAPVAAELVRVDEVARRLRHDCPWDREQTHESLAKYAIEETYELLDAIDAATHSDDDDADEHIIEELGDVLFQVFAHCAIAAEDGRFNITDVARGVSDKLIARHPHVYGDVKAETADDVVATWEANKMAEKKRTGVMDGIPNHLPALAYAQKILSRAASSGYELEESATDDKGVGGALLLMVDHARRNNVDAEQALRTVAAELRSRFDPSP